MLRGPVDQGNRADQGESGTGTGTSTKGKGMGKAARDVAAHFLFFAAFFVVFFVAFFPVFFPPPRALLLDPFALRRAAASRIS